MSIQLSQVAPLFNIPDVDGKIVSLDRYKGQKVLLTFYRNVGCPICNLRFHELEKQSAFFRSKKLALISIYESTSENMRKFLEGESYYSVMIPNPDLSLYNRYQVEKSTGKFFKSMLHGIAGKVKAGKALFKEKIAIDGSFNRVGASFIIDEQGKVLLSYYGKYVGDELPLSEIKKVI
ncbi:redoxin domain-containing protein [Pedobacter sp. L105]|uniref:redoxin domain-containing protein n=1 Tax=Pedobacter sp. L105 TaxID=1641871 RepID=UPI00131E1146|nr:redoxin domain-containing protein [Pedobacter sp. L105]